MRDSRGTRKADSERVLRLTHTDIGCRLSWDAKPRPLTTIASGCGMKGADYNRPWRKRRPRSLPRGASSEGEPDEELAHRIANDFGVAVRSENNVDFVN